MGFRRRRPCSWLLFRVGRDDALSRERWALVRQTDLNFRPRSRWTAPLVSKIPRLCLHRPHSPSPLRGNRSIAFHLFPVTRTSSFRRLQIGSIILCCLVVKRDPLARVSLFASSFCSVSSPRRNSKRPLAHPAIPSRRIAGALLSSRSWAKKAPSSSERKREREEENGRSMIVFLRARGRPLRASGGRSQLRRPINLSPPFSTPSPFLPSSLH